MIFKCLDLFEAHIINDIFNQKDPQFRHYYLKTWINQRGKGPDLEISHLIRPQAHQKLISSTLSLSDFGKQVEPARNGWTQTVVLFA